MQFLLVGTGGFVGAALRYAVSGLVHRAIPFSGFPYGTLVVNLVGCLTIGLLTGLAESRQVMARSFGSSSSSDCWAASLHSRHSPMRESS